MNDETEAADENGSEVEEDAEQQPLILLVEDDPALRLILKNVLETKGYCVLEAQSRATAEPVIKANPGIAVVILDLGLPPSAHTTIEGLGIIRALSDDLFPGKIVVLTGQDEESSALAAIREGAFDFLSKPSKADDILKAVQRALLFYEKEQALASEGLTRLQFNARVSDGLKAVREEAEEKLVKQVLKDTGFNVYQSAARLGLKRESIYYFLKKFGIKRDDS
ncbi:MAG: response regulator [Pseudohongiellaceae bacterium]